MNGRIVFPLALLGGLFYVLSLFSAVLLPFVLAATIAYVLNPLVVMFEVRGVRRDRAVLVIYTVLLFCFVTGAYLAISACIQGASMAASDLTLYTQKTKEMVLELLRHPLFQKMGLSNWAQAKFILDARTWMMSVISVAPALIRVHILPVLELSLLVPFMTFFFMLDGQKFLDGLLELVPARYVEMFLNVVLEINHSFGNYLRGLLIQAFFMGLFTGICYGFIGLHYTVYIAMWAAVSSMIPFLGPISAAAAGALVALFQWGTLSGLVKVLGVFAVIRTLDDWLLQPMIMRRAVHIHPVVSIFALMAGAHVAGMWGLLFAVPVVCMFKVLCEVSWQWYRIEYGLRVKSIPSEVKQIPVV